MSRINTKTLSKHIRIPHKFNKANVENAIKQWFTKNGLTDSSKYVLTQQGLKIHFTGISEWHFVKDVMDSKYRQIALKAICYLAEVFESGQYVEMQDLTKNRVGKRAEFVKFHLFKKQIKIDNYLVTLRAKAGEYPNGKIVLLPRLTGYTFYLAKVREKQKESVADLLNIPLPENQLGHATTPKISREPKSATPIYDSVCLDNVQDEFSTMVILAIEPLPAKTAFDYFVDSCFPSYSCGNAL